MSTVRVFSGLVQKVFLLIGVLLADAAIAEEVTASSSNGPFETSTDPVTYPSSSFRVPPGGDLAQGFVVNDTIKWDSPVEFNPARTYSQQEQDRVIQDEERIHHKKMGSVLTLGPDTDRLGRPVVRHVPEMLIDERSIPEADSPPQVLNDMFSSFFPLSVSEGDDSGSSAFNSSELFLRRHNVNARFGNDMFGSEYNTESLMTVTRQWSGALKLRAQVESTLHARVFNQRYALTRNLATVTSEGSSTEGQIRVYVMNRVVHTRSFSGALSRDAFNRNYHFFNRTKRFMVGPVPMSVTAAVAGTVTMPVTVSLGIGGFTLSVEPGGTATVISSASVNAVVLQFGVNGSLRLINLALPITLTMGLQNSVLNWSRSVERQISTLDGEIGLFTRIRLIFFNRRYDVTLANWRGIVRSREQINREGGNQPMPVASSVRMDLTGD